jgi:hypothetical protein
MAKVRLTRTVQKDSIGPNGLSQSVNRTINKVNDFNKRKRDVEAQASKDSITKSKIEALKGKDIIDQRRAGNIEANKARAKGGNPLVIRGREISHSSYPAGDKYTNPMNVNESGTSDMYSRSKPLEKEMPEVKKVRVAVRK